MAEEGGFSIVHEVLGLYDDDKITLHRDRLQRRYSLSLAEEPNGQRTEEAIAVNMLHELEKVRHMNVGIPFMFAIKFKEGVSCIACEMDGGVDMERDLEISVSLRTFLQQPYNQEKLLLFSSVNGGEQIAISDYYVKIIRGLIDGLRAIQDKTSLSPSIALGDISIIDHKECPRVFYSRFKPRRDSTLTRLSKLREWKQVQNLLTQINTILNLGKHPKNHMKTLIESLQCSPLEYEKIDHDFVFWSFMKRQDFICEISDKAKSNPQQKLFSSPTIARAFPIDWQAKVDQFPDLKILKFVSKKFKAGPSHMPPNPSHTDMEVDMREFLRFVRNTYRHFKENTTKVSRLNLKTKEEFEKLIHQALPSLYYTLWWEFSGC